MFNKQYKTEQKKQLKAKARKQRLGTKPNLVLQKNTTMQCRFQVKYPLRGEGWPSVLVTA